MPADGLGEEPLQVGKVDLRQVLSDLLKIKSRHGAQKLAHGFNHVTPAEGGGGAIEPGSQSLARKPFAPGEQLVEERVACHADDQLRNILLLLHHRGESSLNALQLRIEQIPDPRLDGLGVSQDVDRDGPRLAIAG